MLIRVPTCLEPVFLLVTITFVRMLAMERDKAYPACVTGNRLYAVLESTEPMRDHTGIPLLDSHGHINHGHITH